MPLSLSCSISSGNGYKGRNVSTKSLAEVLTYLEWVSIAVFGHLTDYAAAVTELAHLSGAPSVQTALLIGVSAVVLKEELEVFPYHVALKLALHFKACCHTVLSRVFFSVVWSMWDISQKFSFC